MEYLGSGKVTLSTYSDEYKDKRHILEMTDSTDAFLEQFRKVVTELDIYNSEESQRKRIAFVLDHTYQNQLKKIIQSLNNE